MKALFLATHLVDTMYMSLSTPNTAARTALIAFSTYSMGIVSIPHFFLLQLGGENNSNQKEGWYGVTFQEDYSEEQNRNMLPENTAQ